MIPYFEWKTIELGPLTLQVWGLWVALGMILSFSLIHWRATREGKKSDQLLDQALWMVILGVIFSRLFEVVLYEPAYYFTHLSEIVKIWHGGLSSFGGLIGAVIGFFAYAKWKKISFKNTLQTVDIFSFAALFGWIVGRLGCVWIHDHLGAHSNCFLAMQTSDGARLEMSILEILALLPFAVVFFLNRKKQKPVGWFTSLLFIYYGAIRFFLDFFRATDIVGSDARYWGLTPGQYSGILLLAAGLFIYFKNKK